jgi:hypothetical protein
MTEQAAPVVRHVVRRWASHLKIGAVVSALYIWAYFVTVYMVQPMQDLMLPSAVMSLLFLPHGVRVLSAWLYGWRSVAYLLPGALLCNLHFAGAHAFDTHILVGSAASLLSAPLALFLFRRFLPGVTLSVGGARLGAILAAGFLASVLNLTALRLSYGLPAQEGVVIFVGDASGLLLALLLVRVVLHLLPARP